MNPELRAHLVALLTGSVTAIYDQHWTALFGTGVVMVGLFCWRTVRPEDWGRKRPPQQDYVAPRPWL